MYGVKTGAIYTERGRMRLLYCANDDELKGKLVNSINAKNENAADIAQLLQQIAEKDYEIHKMQRVKKNNVYLQRRIDKLTARIDGLMKDNERIKKISRTAIADINRAQPCFACVNYYPNGGKCYGGDACRHRIAWEHDGKPQPYKDYSFGSNWVYAGISVERGRREE